MRGNEKTYHFSTDFQWQAIESLITNHRKPNGNLEKYGKAFIISLKPVANGGNFPVFTHLGKQSIGISKNGLWMALLRYPILKSFR